MLVKYMHCTVNPLNAECRHALNNMLDRKSESSRGLHFPSGGQGSDAFLVHTASAPTAGPATTHNACAGRVYVARDPYAPPPGYVSKGREGGCLNPEPWFVDALPPLLEREASAGVN